MSDAAGPILIPGTSNRFNSAETIDRLMQVERLPLNRVESEVATIGEQRTAVLDLNRRLATVRDSAKELFGFRNPFDEKLARSSDERVLTATASRAAIESVSGLTVSRIATSDKFASSSLSREYRAPAGSYEFQVGEERVVVPFSGGSLQQLADAINERGQGALRARVINNSTTTQLLSIEADATGASNRIQLEGDALDLGVEIGLVRRSGEGTVDIDLSSTQTRVADTTAFQITDGVLSVSPGGSVRISVPPTPVGAQHELHFLYRTEVLPEETVDSTPPPGPTMPSGGTVTFEGITLRNAPSTVALPQFVPPEQPERRDDRNFLVAEGGGRSHSLAALVDSAGETPATRDLGSLTTIDALVIENRNTHRILHISGARVIDGASRGDQTPVNPVSLAADARLLLDGIEVQRPGNIVDDLLPGVTLTLNGSSPDPVQLEVMGDTELIKGRVIEFIGSYNRLLTEIDILTREDESVVTDAAFLSDEEQETARARLGLFQSDLALLRLKSTLQQSIMDAYPTDADQDLALLSQIGVSTDVRRLGSGLDRTRLRGYLEVDEQQLDTSLAQRRQEVKQLFGNDTDNDLVIDTGVAFVVDRFLTSYIQPNGVMDARLATLDSNLSRRNTQIESLGERLDRREQELREQFTEMEAAVQSLEQSRRTLENLGR